VIRIASNAVIARVLDADDDLKLELNELLSYQVPGAEHNGLMAGGWSGRSTLFNYQKATFPAGLLTLVYSHLKNSGRLVSLIRQPAPAPLGADKPIVNEFGITDRYMYQYDTVDALVRYRAMIAQVATGGGKSNIANIAWARIKRPTLFITTRSVLMHQMKRAFDASIKFRKDAGEDLSGVFCGVMGDGIWAPSKNLNVAMVQTIAAKLANPETEAPMRRILEHFEFVILEEAHESSGEGYYQIMNACKNAHYRLALTGTPFMREDEEANMRLMAVSGPIGIQVTEKELIDKGILATPYFKYLDSSQHPKVRKGSNWQLAYSYGISQNESRNEKIVEEVARAAECKLPTMILVQRKEHGKVLRDLIRERGIRVRYIFGESDQAQRDVALRELGSGRIDVLIGSTILDVGVDVPAVGLIILAGGGKAEVALRQRVGRGLRAKPNGMPNVAFIADFNDKGNKHLTGHAKQRRGIIESTPGFGENILPPGQDFNYQQFKEAL
jgi:superfamily II DNA or RNA helicase